MYFNHLITFTGNPGGGDGNGENRKLAKSSTETRLQDMEKSNSKLPKVPTAVSLVEQSDAAEETNTNDPDPEYAKVHRQSTDTYNSIFPSVRDFIVYPTSFCSIS